MLINHKEKQSDLLPLRQYAECFVLCIARIKWYFSCLKKLITHDNSIRLIVIYIVSPTVFISSKMVSCGRGLFSLQLCFSNVLLELRVTYIHTSIYIELKPQMQLDMYLQENKPMFVCLFNMHFVLITCG